MTEITPFPRLTSPKRPRRRTEPDSEPHSPERPTLLNALLNLAPAYHEELRKVALQAMQSRRPLSGELRAAAILPDTTLLEGFSRASGLLRLPSGPLQTDPDLVNRIGVSDCLRYDFLPLGRIGTALHLAIIDPEAVTTLPRLPAFRGHRLTFSLTTRSQLRSALLEGATGTLVERAEATLPASRSVRGLKIEISRSGRILLASLIGAVLFLMPLLPVILLFVWMTLALLTSGGLRALALWQAARHGLLAPEPELVPLQYPKISILVPLYHEPDIAPRLVRRLERLRYPRSALDIVLLLEESDTATREALERANLPGWMQMVVVPAGSVTTKPRAMNYGLNFTSGTLIGVYDAEDEPDPDQLLRVAARFAAAPPDLACLQGALDYYNPRSTLVARLFTAEYAAWFRVMMPALQKLRFPMPLGGTTLFIRRDHLISIGAWDAHNVTEDADLGVRLARAGLRTEMLPVTTHEEANCHLRPWIKQRSRWIKGHMLTWAVHMRNPFRLWRELGARGFLGYQILFLGAQTQVLLAPLNWSFWLLLLGLPHPARDFLSPTLLTLLTLLFLISELLLIATATLALRGTRHPELWPITALFQVYHLFAAVAGWRAFLEAFRNPFYWAKTSHGRYDSEISALGEPPAPSESPMPQKPIPLLSASSAAQPGQVKLFTRAPKRDEPP